MGAYVGGSRPKVGQQLFIVIANDIIRYLLNLIIILPIKKKRKETRCLSGGAAVRGRVPNPKP